MEILADIMTRYSDKLHVAAAFNTRNLPCWSLRDTEVYP